MDKFKNYKKACKFPNADFIIIDHIWVIWDTVDEIDINIKQAIDNNKYICVVNWDYIIKKNDLQNR